MGFGVGIPYVAEGAIIRGTAVMAGTAYPQVKPTTGANVKVLGFALADADDGQEVAIHPVTDGTSAVRAIAATGITRGDPVMASATTGALKILPSDSTLKYGCGFAGETATTGQLFDVLPSYFHSAVTT